MRFFILVTCFALTLAGCANNGQSTRLGLTSSSGPMGEPVRDIAAYGLVTQVSVADRVINIKHAPIPEMNWSQMLMSFKVVNTVDLTYFKRGDLVEFVLEVDREDNYRIKEISAKDN